MSHISDICMEGTISAVEVSRRVFQNMLALAETRRNVPPILADASRPDAYANKVERVDFVYQDIAKRDQVSLFLETCGFWRETAEQS